MSNDITPVSMSKSEAWELTDEIRQGYESIHANRMEQVARLAEAYEKSAWQVMGYDSFDEYHIEEFGEDLQHQRLELEDRINAVKMLSDAGLTKSKIAEILGVHRNTVSNLVKRIDAQEPADAQRCASNEVDAAGQSVEEVGHIDEREPQLLVGSALTPPVIENTEVSAEPIKDSDDEQDARSDSWLDEINFEALVLPVAKQIEPTEAGQDTTEFFTPRSVTPSWSPPQVRELPPPPEKRYDVPTPEFLEPPLTLPQTPEPTKDDGKHCKTCACNLLP